MSDPADGTLVFSTTGTETDLSRTPNITFSSATTDDGISGITVTVVGSASAAVDGATAIGLDPATGESMVVGEPPDGVAGVFGGNIAPILGIPCPQIPVTVVGAGQTVAGERFFATTQAGPKAGGKCGPVIQAV